MSSAVLVHENDSSTRFLTAEPCFLVNSRLADASAIARAMVSVFWSWMIIPNSLEGMSSSAPPIFVVIAAVPHAAASSRVVAKPSEREGRHSMSACDSSADTSDMFSCPTR